MSSAPEPSRPVRVEIQALRAAAVLLVVVYHLWPSRLPGGFVGVDVFFVLSGFLMTAHLLREIDRTGSISITAFWARRARRLLPAAFVVLLAVSAVTVFALPDTFWRRFGSEVAASALYVQNWLLAQNSVDYLAAQNAASPVQHFWSLSVEEQFYLVWPAILLAVALLTRTRSALVRRRWLLGAIAAITAGSLATSIVWTAAMPQSAYFVTPTRIWELTLGGLLCFIPAGFVSNTAVRSAASWLGIAGIGVAAVVITPSTPFPGSAALLPVVSTAMVVWAGAPTTRWSPTAAMSLRPVQFIGNVSYSWYLWHWPLIVLIPLLRGAELGSLTKAAIFATSLALAWASYRFVENRFRYPVSTRRPRSVIAVAVLASVAITAVSVGSIVVVDARNAANARELLAADANGCFGAGAMDEANDCPSPFTDSGVMTPAFAKTDVNFIADPRGGWLCETPRGESAIRTCDFGTTDGQTRTIAMLGDSHSLHFRSALELIAETRGWKLITYFKSACSGTGNAEVVLPVRPEDQEPCSTWGRDAIASIVHNPDISAVVFANVASAYFEDDGAAPIGPAVYSEAWRTLTDAGKTVVVVADVPRVLGDIPDCLSTGNDAACSLGVAAALPYDATADAASRWPDDSVRLVDLTDKFCRDDICHARIGGVIAYSDSGHLTNTFARSLAPYLDAALTE